MHYLVGVEIAGVQLANKGRALPESARITMATQTTEIVVTTSLNRRSAPLDSPLRTEGGRHRRCKKQKHAHETSCDEALLN